jgi:hypothetical protein
MLSFRKATVVIVLCGSILVFWGSANRGGSFEPRPVSVSLETSPCRNNGSEKIKVALKAQVNGSSLPHGKVVLQFRRSDQATAMCPVEFQPTEGYTDRNGIFITNWCPPCPGKYLVCAEVSKSGFACGRLESHFALSNQSLNGGTRYDSTTPCPPKGIRSGI